MSFIVGLCCCVVRAVTPPLWLSPAGFALTWPDRLLTFGVKPVRQPPVGNSIVRALTIEARWAIHIANDLRRAGHALDGVLKEVGLERADLANPEDRIPYAAYVGLIERAALLLGDPGYGLKLGASHGVRDIGLIGFIALNSPTLGDALASIERYVRVTNEGIDAVFEADGQGATLRFRETDASLRGLRHNSEQAAAQIVRGARELTRRKATPVRAEFMHGRPNARIDYEGILGCPVKFRAEWDGVVFAEETLRLPVIGADNKLLRVLESRLPQDHRSRPAQHDLIHSVREYVVQRLAKGAVPFDDVARPFRHERQDAGAAARRARRELSRAGRGHPLRLAERYLADTDLRLQQIAYLFGLFRAAPLVRAFKRWTGSTPCSTAPGNGDGPGQKVLEYCRADVGSSRPVSASERDSLPFAKAVTMARLHLPVVLMTTLLVALPAQAQEDAAFRCTFKAVFETIENDSRANQSMRSNSSVIEWMC